MKILVFKTNVTKPEQLKNVQNLFKPIISVIEWNVDLMDRDKVLRVVTSGLPALFIESLLQTSGFYCKELED